MKIYREEYIGVRYNTDGIEKLMTAARTGEVGCIKELIESGIDIEATDKDGKTALMIAAEHGQPECVEKLVKLGADIEAEKSMFGGTALMVAAEHGQVECIKRLVELGANIEAKDKDGGTALMYAAFKGQSECIQKLVDLGANIEAEDKYNQTALMIAAQHGKVGCIKELLDLGADMKAKDKDGYTALMTAAQDGQVKCIEILVEHGVNIDAKVKDYRGRTALMVAAEDGRVECIEKLVELGANIQAKDEDGYTALMIAAYRGHVGCIKKLVKLGADIAVTTNGDGNNAISHFELWDENRLSQFIDFIKCIYENYMSLNEAIINQIEMRLDLYHYRRNENYIKARILLFQIKNPGDLKAKFNQPDALLTTGRDLFVEARNCRIQRIINFWKQQKWFCEARKAFVETIEKKLPLPPEIINKIFSFFLPRYLEGKIVFSKDILDASGGVIGAEECSVMVTSYYCQESAEEMEKLLRQEEKPEKKNIS